MISHQQRVLQALRRVQAWCAANPALVPPPTGDKTAWPPLTRQLDVIDTLVAQLTTAAADQGVQKQKATLAATDEPSLRKQLRDELRTVTQVAQALRKMVPGIGTLRMPSPHMQSEALLKAADALTKQAATYETVLVEHGLAPDFTTQLAAASAALRASIDGRGAARASRASATRLLAVDASLGIRYIQIMDAALSKTLRNDPAKLREWKVAKRITVKGVSKGGSNAAPTPAVGTTSASTPGTDLPSPVPASVAHLPSAFAAPGAAATTAPAA